MATVMAWVAERQRCGWGREGNAGSEHALETWAVRAVILCTDLP